MSLYPEKFDALFFAQSAAVFFSAALLASAVTAPAPEAAREKRFTMEDLKLTSEWDKTFPQSDKAEHSKVTFHTDFCDRTDIIPFDKMAKFFNEYLK